MAVSSSYSLKWHGHSVHLNSCISGLYRCDAFTDVILATSDGRYIAAHQFVLSACSPFLHNMFLVGGASYKAKVVVVLPPDVGHATLSILLQYIYKGEAIVNHEDLPSIMKAAELLQIRGLCGAKDKKDPNSNYKSSSGVLRKHTSSSSEVQKNHSETKKNNHWLLVAPEGRYGSEASNTICKTSRAVSKTPPMSITIPAKKKSRVNNNNEDTLRVNNNSNSSSIVENIMIEKMIVGEEIQVKDEPLDWEEQRSNDGSDSIVKQEVVSEEEVSTDNLCAPLTCDLCQEMFTSPALWVRHINTNHPTTALASGKRFSDEGEGSKEYPLLHCELCQQVFSVPADWVRHVESHAVTTQDTNSEPAESMATVTSGSVRAGGIKCDICGKVLQSQASMQIHARTHTGERPYLCKVCGHEFNVKSNYLRHLRTVHDRMENASDIQ